MRASTSSIIVLCRNPLHSNERELRIARYSYLNAKPLEHPPWSSEGAWYCLLLGSAAAFACECRRCTCGFAAAIVAIRTQSCNIAIILRLIVGALPTRCTAKQCCNAVIPVWMWIWVELGLNNLRKARKLHAWVGLWPPSRPL